MRRLVKLMLSAAVLAVILITVAVNAAAESSGSFTYSVLSDGTLSITGYIGTLSSVTIPSTLDGKKVTEISDGAFSGTKIKSMTIPSGIRKIGDEAFYKAIYLAEITVAQSSKYFTAENGILYDKSMNRLIAYPGGKTTASYTLPSTVKTVSDRAFSGNCYLTNVRLSDSVTELGEGLFEECRGLKSAVLSASIKKLPDSAFKNCSSLLSVNIPKNVTDIGCDSFYNCYSLSELGLAEGVRYIGAWAFGNCDSLKSLTLPQSVSEAGNYAFYSMDSLRSLTAYEKLTEIGTAAFSDLSSEFVLSCIEGSALHTYAADNKIAVRLISHPLDKLTAEADAESVTLSWSKDAAADGYIIYRYTGTQWERVKKITSNSVTSYKLTGLSPSVTYKLAVKTYKLNSSGAYYSANKYAAVTTKPAAVSGLSAVSLTDTEITLGWDKNSGAHGYIIYGYNGGSWVRLKKITSPNTHSCTLGGYSASAVYKFAVKCYRMDGKTALYSENAYISVKTKPSAVTGLTAVAATQTSLTLSWDKNNSTHGYLIYRYDGKTWVKIKNVTSRSVTSYTVKTLTAGTEYKFAVKTYRTDSDGTVVYGKNAYIAAVMKPAAVTGLNVVSTGKVSVSLDWDKNVTADGYIIYRYNGNEWIRIGKRDSMDKTSFTATGLASGTEYKFCVKTYIQQDGKTAYGGKSYISAVTK